DEASFFSPAYNFAMYGNLATTVHKDFLPGAAAYTYWMPPLYMLLLGTVFKIFGVSILNAKLLSLVLVLLSAYIITRWTRNRNIQLPLAAIFLICPFVILVSTYIRMEALAIFLTVLAF